MASQVDEAFCFDNIVRGHHIYKAVWTLFLRGILTVTPEPNYRYDRINNSSTSDSTTLRPDPSSRFFARSFFHSQTLFSSIPYIWAAALLTWRRVFSSSLLWKLLVPVFVTPCLSTCNCRCVPLTIQNVNKCGVYSKEAAIFLYSSAGVVSIQGQPLNRLCHLFRQVQYILLCDMLFVDLFKRHSADVSV